MKVINGVIQGHNFHILIEIYSADDREVDVRYFGDSICDAIQNNHTCPTKPKIIIKDYRIWKKFLYYLCVDNDMILSVPLGKWNLHSDPKKARNLRLIHRSR